MLNAKKLIHGAGMPRSWVLGARVGMWISWQWQSSVLLVEMRTCSESSRPRSGAAVAVAGFREQTGFDEMRHSSIRKIPCASGNCDLIVTTMGALLMIFLGGCVRPLFDQTLMPHTSQGS